MANKQKLEVEKPADIWNPEERKWTKTASREMFFDMKDEANGSSHFNPLMHNVPKWSDTL